MSHLPHDETRSRPNEQYRRRSEEIHRDNNGHEGYATSRDRPNDPYSRHVHYTDATYTQYEGQRREYDRPTPTKPRRPGVEDSRLGRAQSADYRGSRYQGRRDSRRDTYGYDNRGSSPGAYGYEDRRSRPDPQRYDNRESHNDYAGRFQNEVPQNYPSRPQPKPQDSGYLHQHPSPHRYQQQDKRYATGVQERERMPYSSTPGHVYGQQPSAAFDQQHGRATSHTNHDQQPRADQYEPQGPGYQSFPKHNGQQPFPSSRVYRVNQTYEVPHPAEHQRPANTAHTPVHVHQEIHLHDQQARPTPRPESISRVQAQAPYTPQVRYGDAEPWKQSLEAEQYMTSHLEKLLNMARQQQEMNQQTLQVNQEQAETTARQSRLNQEAADFLAARMLATNLNGSKADQTGHVFPPLHINMPAAAHDGRRASYVLPDQHVAPLGSSNRPSGWRGYRSRKQPSYGLAATGANGIPVTGPRIPCESKNSHCVCSNLMGQWCTVHPAWNKDGDRFSHVHGRRNIWEL